MSPQEKMPILGTAVLRWVVSAAWDAQTEELHRAMGLLKMEKMLNS